MTKISGVVAASISEMERAPQYNGSGDYQSSVQHLHAFGDVIKGLIGSLLRASSINYHSITYRVKERASAERKVSSNPDKYESFQALTDLLGVRIITHFNDEVDQVAKILENQFSVDENNSVDKRKSLEPDRFGYLSLHYILSLDQARSQLMEYREYTGLQFEVQIRSILQHAWAEIEHDLGYKAKSVIPDVLRRRFSRVAGLLEVADDEFQYLREEILKYEGAVAEKISRSTEGLSVDSSTLSAFIRASDLVRELDNAIAELLPEKVQFEYRRGRMSDYARMMRSVGFVEIAQIEQHLRVDRENILKFAAEFLRGHRHSFNSDAKTVVMNPGLSLLYLFYLKVAQLEDSKRLAVLQENFHKVKSGPEALSVILKSAWEQASS